MISQYQSSFCLPHQYRKRQGNLLLVALIVLALVVTAVIATYALGSSGQKKMDDALRVGHHAFVTNQPAAAIKAFQNAEALFGISLRFYRKLSGIAHKQVSENELKQLLVSACLMKAYADFLKLHPSPKPLALAKQRLKELHGPAKSSLQKNVDTATEVNQLIQQLTQKKFRPVLKGLLQAEKNALPTDRDFFLAEIRILAACGNALKDTNILTQARELLWYLNYEIGVEGKQIDDLWSIIGQ